MTGGPPLLELDGVDAAYGAVQVLFEVGLALGSGESLAVLGSNGAGKSTLLRVISGLRPCTAGRMRWRGSTVAGLTAERRCALGIAHVMGGSGTFPPLTVGENLRAGAYRYRGRDAHRRVQRSLEQFPMLASRLDTRAADLSGGQQHLLALAVALVHDPDLLLIDELSLGLAPVMVDQVLDVVRGLRSSGLALVVVEQSADLALGLADRAIFMEKGTIRFDGPSAVLAGRHDLLRVAFLGGGP